MNPQIGDFIALASLAAKAFQALNSTRGSKFEFTSLLNTLESLSEAMLQAEELCIGCHTSSFDNTSKDLGQLDLLDSVAYNISKERKECEALIQRFMENFAPYNEAFMEPGIGKIRQGVRKLTWIGRQDEIAVWEKRLNR